MREWSAQSRWLVGLSNLVWMLGAIRGGGNRRKYGGTVVESKEVLLTRSNHDKAFPVMSSRWMAGRWWSWRRGGSGLVMESRSKLLAEAQTRWSSGNLLLRDWNLPDAAAGRTGHGRRPLALASWTYGQ